MAVVVEKKSRWMEPIGRTTHRTDTGSHGAHPDGIFQCVEDLLALFRREKNINCGWGLTASRIDQQGHQAYT